MKFLIFFPYFFSSFLFSQENKSFFKNKKEPVLEDHQTSSSIKSKSFFKKKDDIIKNENNIDLNQVKKKPEENNTIKNDSISNYTIQKDSLSEEKNISFLDSPVDEGKITSGYSKKRFHPVLKKWQEHNGTDFAAPYGSSIKATAGGVVEVAGYSSGNGNFVKIKHNSTYSTQYLHMSKILVTEGDSIKLGQEIGLVGSSGLATGPHVCYRFWKNGVQVDPFSLEFSNEEIVSVDKIDQDAAREEISGEEENEKEFKSFVSGFFKKKTSTN